MRKRNVLVWLAAVLFLALLGFATVYAWDPLPVDDDPLLRMPGTQPGQVTLEGPSQCLNCHSGYDPAVEPGFNWQGSMMAQSSRDFLFWACLTVAGQDSIWAIGRPNAVDICERCHFPKGWLEGRSDPPNASAMTGDDYDGVQCDFCHAMFDPFFETTYAGTREGDDWVNYWDETNASGTPSQPAADATYAEDAALTQTIALFNGNAFYSGSVPFSPDYTENASGQYFISGGGEKRASFADAAVRHTMFYSRYHKSRYFCSTCHDVSNPALANLAFEGTPPGDGVTILPTEELSAYAYYHVERTFSEFMLSAYGQQGGAAGIGPFDPAVFETSYPNNYIAKCQDCHMRDVVGRGCNKNDAPIRPTESIEHPNSGVPLHDMSGGNAWVSYVLASAIPGSPNYDATNDQLLHQGPAVLTLDLSQGLGVDPLALLEGVTHTQAMLTSAAAIEDLAYEHSTGLLTFRLQNQTAHKLISGFPEGRRMFVSIQAYAGGNLVYALNPYDDTAGTLKGLDYPYLTDTLPLPAPLLPHETHLDELIYEVHPSSSLTLEPHTFHFVLADGRYKDNRIPPPGFDIASAPDRLSEPVWEGAAAPDYFTPQEYLGGYDAVSLTLPPDADTIQVRLYYQTTSREYVEFLRNEILGTGPITLPPEAYIVQSDTFFEQLKAWGDTIWQLWTHNMDVPGAAPFLMAEAVYEGDCIPVYDADFAWTPPLPNVGESVTFTATASGTPPISYAWDFGDGAGGAGALVTHAYAAAGDYLVTLTATNPCGVEVVTHTVSVGQPCDPVHDADFSWAPTTPPVGQYVAFTGTAQGDPPITYAWDFGDGVSGTGASITHTYSVGGDYDVVMTATNACGQTVVQHTVHVCAPVANPEFTWVPITPTVGEEVTWNGTAEGTAPLTYTWDLGSSSLSYAQGGTACCFSFAETAGDSTAASGVTVTHAYTAPGTYEVVLTVTNPCGEEVISHAITVVTGCNPVRDPDFDWVPLTPTVGVEVTFTGTAGGTPPLTYTWGLGDGTGAAGSSITHTYTTAGLYRVAMTVTNGCGWGTVAHTLTVLPPCDPAHDADFAWTPITPTIGEQVVFTGTALGDSPIAFAWDFGDGTGGTGNTVLHAFAAAGDYAVTMTATNACGEAIARHTLTVVAGCNPVHDARFTWLPAVPTVGEMVTLEAMAGGTPPFTYTWDLGDGAVAAGVTVTHAYAAAGLYTVTLTATNACGSDQVTHAITVAGWRVYLPLLRR